MVRQFYEQLRKQQINYEVFENNISVSISDN